MKDTLIGKTIKVVDAKNKSLAGVEGKVIDETKNTIKIIGDKNKEKTLIKSQLTIEVNGKIVEGEKLTKRIEERIKR